MSNPFQSDTPISRRRLVLGGTALAAGAALAMPAFVRAQGSKKALKVSIGRIPWAAGNSPMTQYMIENKLFETHAAELGYELTVDWRDYPSALPMVRSSVHVGDRSQTATVLSDRPDTSASPPENASERTDPPDFSKAANARPSSALNVCASWSSPAARSRSARTLASAENGQLKSP